MATEPRIGTHWRGCWKAHDDCCEEAVTFLAEGAELLMLDVLAADDEDPNALEMQHRLRLLGFTDTDQFDGSVDHSPPAIAIGKYDGNDLSLTDHNDGKDGG